MNFGITNLKISKMYRSTRNSISTNEIYIQGSEACRNYSKLTMKVKITSQHFLILLLIGISSNFISDFNILGNQTLLIICGGIIISVAISLLLVTWHYQSAFVAIRDKLASIEIDSGFGEFGVWSSHKAVRQKWDKLATIFPFLVMALIALIMICCGFIQ